MMRNFTIVLLLIAGFSGMCFAQEAAPAAAPAAAQAQAAAQSAPSDDTDQMKDTSNDPEGLSAQLLPYHNILDQVTLKDGTNVILYPNTMPSSTSSGASLSFVPIPRFDFGEVDNPVNFDPKTNRVRFKLSFDYPTDEIRQIVQTTENLKKYKDYQIKPIIIRGFVVSITSGPVREDIEISNSKITDNMILRSINCSKEITDPQLIKALENIDNVNIEVTVFAKFKEDSGSEVRYAAERYYNEKINEKIFGSGRDSFYMNKKNFEDMLRDANASIKSESSAANDFVIVGTETSETKRIIDKFIKRLIDKTETSLDDLKSAKDSLLFYDKELGILELRPEVIDNIINDSNKSEVEKTKLFQEFHELREFAKKFTDVNDFLKEAIKSDKFSASLSIYGYGGGGSFETSNTDKQASHNEHHKDMFEKLKNDSISDKELYRQVNEQIKGDMKKFLTTPKQYTVIRVSQSEFHQLASSYFKHVTVITYGDAAGFKTGIKEGNSARLIQELRKDKQDLTDKLEELKAEDSKKIEALNAEIDKLNQIIIELLKSH